MKSPKLLLVALLAPAVIAGGLAMSAGTSWAGYGEPGGMSCTLPAVNAVDCAVVAVAGVGLLEHPYYVNTGTPHWSEDNPNSATADIATTCTIPGSANLQIFGEKKDSSGNSNVSWEAYGSGWSSYSSISVLAGGVRDITCAYEFSHIFVFVIRDDGNMYQDTWAFGVGWSGWALSYNI